MSKKKRTKKYNPKKGTIETAHKVAARYILAGVTDIKDAVFVFNEEMVDVHFSRSTADMINKIRHHWTMVCCVAGRYKNGKVWIRYEQVKASVQALAEEVSPLVTTFVDEFFEKQDPDTRLCKWWLATARYDHDFTAEEVITPAYKADIFRAFITKKEKEAGVEFGNHPSKPPKELTLGEFKEWWDNNRSPKSQLKELWLEETADGV